MNDIVNDIVGTIGWNEETYQVSWPFLLEKEQEPELITIYKDGVKVQSFSVPEGRAKSKKDVMYLAFQKITQEPGVVPLRGSTNPSLYSSWEG